MSSYRAEGISLRYGNRTVLSDVSLDVTPGEVLVLVGPNGAGKSTLLKGLAGELPISAGTVRLDETEITAMPPVALARRRGVLPQASSLSFPFTVHEVVRLGLSGFRRASQMRNAVDEALARVDLAAFSGRPYHALSGGERQRVHLARVLCQVPEPRRGDEACFLFLDEPTSGLDLKHQTMILEIARAFAAAGGGVLAVLHDLNLAATYADRIAVVAGGGIAMTGPAHGVITDAMIREAFGVDLEVSGTPSDGAPFVLPHTIRSASRPRFDLAAADLRRQA